MTRANLRLVQVFPPLVGGLLIFKLEGAELGEVISWQWAVEATKGGKSHWQGIRGNASGARVELAYLHKRIKADVLLSGQRKLSAMSYPVLSPEEYSKDVNLESLREFADSIAAKIQDLRSASKAFVVERSNFEAVHDLPQKLARIEELVERLKAENTDIQSQRSLLAEEHKKLTNAQERHKVQTAMDLEQIRAQWKELRVREQEINENHIFQKALEEKRNEIAKVRELWDRVENAWDVIDKARHLKVVLTNQNLEAIMAIVASETEAKRISNTIESLSQSSNGKTCHHFATRSDLVGWPSICADCSK